MYKTATYKEKYVALQDWMPSIIEEIKKDIKNEHLKKDLFFVKKYLATKNINKITTEELVEAYKTAIAEEENGEDLAEFLTSRWLLKNSELYDFFDSTLSKINPDFSKLEEIDLPKSKAIINEANHQFGALPTYLFAVLNSVVFPQEAFQYLAEQAQKEKHSHNEASTQLSEKLTTENMQRQFELEINRLTDKYEKKLNGLQKKYHTDIDQLKKQVAHLQKKLHESSHKCQ